MIRKRILFVEDDRDIRQVVSNFLSSEGYDISVASDGMEALQFLENCESSIDLIILDLMMPNMDGFEFFQKFKAMQVENEPSVILMSAGSSLEHKRYLLGAQDSLRKPLNILDLLDIVERNLGSSKLRPQKSLISEKKSL